MYQTPEQLIALNRSNIDAALLFAGVALQSMEKLVGLQIETAKAALADSADSVRALATVKEPKDLVTLRDRMLQPTLEKASAYARTVYDVAVSTQSELNKLFEAQIADYNKSVVSVLDNAATNATLRTGIVSMNLTLTLSGENVSLQQQVHVDNVP